MVEYVPPWERPGLATGEERVAIAAHEDKIASAMAKVPALSASTLTQEHLQLAFLALREAWSVLVAVADLRGITEPARANVSAGFLCWWQDHVDTWFRVRTSLLFLAARFHGLDVPNPLEGHEETGRVVMFGEPVGRVGFELLDD